MTDKPDFYEMVLTGLTALIRSRLESQSAEEWHPVYTADASDDRIALMRKEVLTYRRLRQEFEDCHSRVCTPVVKGADASDAMGIES